MIMNLEKIYFKNSSEIKANLALKGVKNLFKFYTRINAINQDIFD
jgi:hypothetical protein